MSATRRLLYYDKTKRDGFVCIPQKSRGMFVRDWVPSEGLCMLYVYWHHIIISSYHSFAVAESQSTDNETMARKRMRLFQFLAVYVANKQQ